MITIGGMRALMRKSGGHDLGSFLRRFALFIAVYQGPAWMSVKPRRTASRASAEFPCKHESSCEIVGKPKTLERGKLHPKTYSKQMYFRTKW